MRKTEQDLIARAGQVGMTEQEALVWVAYHCDDPHPNLVSLAAAFNVTYEALRSTLRRAEKRCDDWVKQEEAQPDAPEDMNLTRYAQALKECVEGPRKPAHSVLSPMEGDRDAVHGKRLTIDDYKTVVSDLDWLRARMPRPKQPRGGMLSPKPHR